jgi:hypothetical protein
VKLASDGRTGERVVWRAGASRKVGRVTNTASVRACSEVEGRNLADREDSLNRLPLQRLVGVIW